MKPIKQAEELLAIANAICEKEFPDMTELQKLCFVNGFLTGYRLLASDILTEQLNEVNGAAV